MDQPFLFDDLVLQHDIQLPDSWVGGAWRAASGFAHGYWPNLRASQPRAAIPGADGVHTVFLVIDEDKHRPLADYCHTMLNRSQEHYDARDRAR
ncbi:hypothetical protein [Streptomyces sp. PanSC9]|uniref:hypothetical protein n=1 Tax=Streptomyces sp. PanSC9 TaxID=1520461 RepID=UPI000F49CC33|nr:hypothetical protein [Streptomyces sp. PanSC9]